MYKNKPHFSPFYERMLQADLPEVFIETFAFYYDQLVHGRTGLIAEDEIVPVTAVPDAEALSDTFVDIGEQALAKTAVIKLNGGLGTSMGLEHTKSLLPVKQQLTFLDITARQVQQTNTPLVLMNSFATEADSLATLAKYNLAVNIPQSFLQHKAPKVRRDNLLPVEWPPNPELTWCPPGHGDIYTAVYTSGTLSALLNAGYKYAFVSNADNLGAVLDPAILGYFVHHNYSFMMEVADRTEMDKKGGHLAQLPNGQLILRESAQCPDEDVPTFQDVTRHRYFNTNNLWLNLPALQQLLAEHSYRLGLPMIRNKKTVDPRDPSSTPVYQLETAMGSAIAVFADAQALRVPRTRFAPVKTTDDLFLIRSDVYELTDDFRVVMAAARNGRQPIVNLDPHHYKFVPDMDAHFPHGLPAMLACDQLNITGDVYFGSNIRCVGSVIIQNRSQQPITIPENTILSGTYVFE
ncbi:MAG: UTP--glucose-1-phosphate uridylyltransferase [Candidatus Promineifilaceae bacterium]